MSWRDTISKEISEEEKKRIESINAISEAMKMLPDQFDKSLKRLSGKVDEKEYAKYEKMFGDILNGMRVYRRTLMQGKVD